MTGTTDLSHSGSLVEASKEAKSETKLNTKMAVRGTKTDQFAVNLINRGMTIAEVLLIMKAANLLREDIETAKLTRMKTLKEI